MLNKIKVNELEVGSRYSAPIFFDDGQNMLLNANTPITDYEIGVLKQWKIPYVVTAGRIIPEGETFKPEPASELERLIDEAEEIEELEELDEFDGMEELSEVEDKTTVSDTAESDQAAAQNDGFPYEAVSKICSDTKSKELYKTYMRLINNINEFFRKLKMRQPVEALAVTPFAETVRSLIKNDFSLCVSFILGTEVEENNLARSSVNIAILAVIISEALNLSDKQTNDITVAAILHDVGMMKIADTILNKTEALSEAEKQTVAAHTSYGYKTALSELLYTKEVAISIMQHHERWDGKGQPNGLAGEEIDLGARIIAVADTFVAMITPKPHRDLILGYQAMKNLLADNARLFDPSIVKAMIRSLGIYPIGSIILMNDSSIARVIKSSPEAPMRPVIKILIDGTGQIVNEADTVVDLRQNKNLFIVKALDPRAYGRKTA